MTIGRDESRSSADIVFYTFTILKSPGAYFFVRDFDVSDKYIRVANVPFDLVLRRKRSETRGS